MGKEAVQVTKALQFSNSIMNVFVYAVRSPDFKETFGKILCVRVRDIRKRAYTAMSLKDRKSMQLAHLAPLKMALSGSVTVMLQLEDNEVGYNENTRLGIGTPSGCI